MVAGLLRFSCTVALRLRLVSRLNDSVCSEWQLLGRAASTCMSKHLALRAPSKLGNDWFENVEPFAEEKPHEPRLL